jgi:hypothetical protein
MHVPLILFTTIITTYNAPRHRIHAPYRIVPIAENSTVAPRFVENNVLISFQLKCFGTWNARMFSGSMGESHLFLMDQDDIPVMHSHILATGNEIRIKIYNLAACLLLAYTIFLKNLEACLLQKTSSRPNLNFILYRKMLNKKKSPH